MSRTPSNMLPLGTVAPSFKALDTKSNTLLSLEEVKGDKGTVIMFISNHCPFVKHINAEIAQLAKDYTKMSIGFVAICSNDIINYPDDAPHLMKQLTIDQGFIFPYLYDQTQEIATTYDAACTPDFYLFDAKLKLVYRGQLDNSRPENGIPVTGIDLRYAIDALLQGNKINPTQKPSIGCNIKWFKK